MICSSNTFLDLVSNRILQKWWGNESVTMLASQPSTKKYFIVIYTYNAEMDFFTVRIFRLISSVWKCFVCKVFAFCFPELMLQEENLNISLRLSASRSIGMISKPFSDDALPPFFHTDRHSTRPKFTWDTALYIYSLLQIVIMLLGGKKRSEFQQTVISKCNKFSFH